MNCNSAPLEILHRMDEFQGQRNSSAKGMTLDEDGFQQTYQHFIRDVIRPHLEEDYIIYECRPGLRVHFAGQPGLTPAHIDADHGHSAWEINFWLPLTKAYGSATLWAESSPGQGDFHAFVSEYGNVVRFYGNRCLHL